MSVIRFLSNGLSTVVFLIRSKVPLRLLYIFLVTQVIEIRQKKASAQKIKEYPLVGRFTTDWFTPNIPVWSAILGNNFSPDQELKILEIGAWEGMSTTYLAQEFPKALITSVDTWVGSDEHTEVDMIEVEALFDNNVKKFDGRVLKHKSTSRNYFANLPDGEQFDLIYIDGSHHSRDVILDAIQGFAHLKVNGIMIFDDYLWRFYPAIFHNAAAALHLFIKLHSFELNLLRASYQLIVQKSSH